MSKRKNPEAKARQQRNRRRRDLAAGKSVWVPRGIKCLWCDRPVIWRDVVVGRGPTKRTLRLLVGRDPAPDGRVIRLNDGTWRVPARGIIHPDAPAFYVHSPRECLLTDEPWETPQQRYLREVIEAALSGPDPDGGRVVHSPHAS